MEDLLTLAAQALAEGEPAKARAFYDQALESCDQDDYGIRWDILAAREQALQPVADRTAQANNLTQMQIMADLMSDDRRRAITHYRRARYFEQIAEYQAAVEAAQTTVRFARRANEPELEAKAFNRLAALAGRYFDYLAVSQSAHSALALLPDQAAPDIRLTSLLWLAEADYHLGRYETALVQAQQAQDLAHQVDQQDAQARAGLILGQIYHRLGDYDRAEKYFQTALQKQRFLDDRAGEAISLVRLGWLACDQAQYQAGLQYCQEAIDISGYSITEAEALSCFGFSHEQLGHLDTARSTYRQALALHQELGLAPMAMFDRTGLARLSLAQNDIEAARRYIMIVTDWVLAGNTAKFWDPGLIYYWVYHILLTLDETETAQNILEEAHTFLQQRAKAITQPDLQASFLEKVEVHQKLEQAWQNL